MKCDIFQEPFMTLSEIINKCNRYTSLGAEELAEKGRSGGVVIGMVHGAAHFVQIYFFKLGIFDGGAGLMISICKGLGSFLNYAKLGEISRKSAASS